ncbi:dihydrofolate reductase [Kocuria coralli]|uniref:Dihydrofolate reductase n=1 Tax=Kocuria coralli TaxID=1461025 RepID=A0A5J5KTS0_9MICC|nr:dihydrofolate reductase family protein [Kocuria coralli]KAA9393177.1 dihydrofolate reductase [Kocuria coralli]
MRTLAITQNITIDGRVEMLGDWFDPADEAPDVLAEMHRQDETCDAVLLGRQTFEDFRGYWPEQTDDQTGVTDQLNAVAKYVVSSTMTDPGWQNSTVISGDVLDAVRRLKEQPGQDIVCTGSITLCHALLEAGLVDELRLFTYPVVQGEGRRLFTDDVPAAGADLIASMRFGNGVTYTGWALRR